MTLLLILPFHSVNIRATAIDSKGNPVSGAGTISLGSGTTIVKIVVKAENGDTRTYQVSIAKGNGNGRLQLLSPRQRAARREVSPDQRWGPGGSTGTSSSGSTSGSDSGTSGPGSSTSGTQSSYPEGLPAPESS